MNRLLYTLIYLCSFFCLASCDNEDDSEDASAKKGDGSELVEEDNLPLFNRTVLVYMVAENSLATPDRDNAYLGFHGEDSLEIVKAIGSIEENNCLLLYVDDTHAPRIYRFSKEKGVLLVRKWQEDVSSVDPETLQQVLTWASNKYTAKEYGLVLWSHSSGWIPASSTAKIKSFGIDNGGNSYSDYKDGKLAPQMDISGLAAAIENSVHLRFILFDTCLMGDIETAFTLRRATDYVIASPISIHGAGGYYTGLVENGFFCEDITQIARTYFSDVTSKDLLDVYQNYGMVIAAIKTDALDALADTCRKILPRSILRGKQSPVLSYVTNYTEYSGSGYYRPKCVDAKEVMSLLLSDEENYKTNESDYASWCEALERAVPYHAATENFTINNWSTKAEVNVEDCICLSMFIPQNIYTSNAKNCLYGDLNEAFRQTEWYEAAGWAQTGW